MAKIEWLKFWQIIPLWSLPKLLSEAAKRTNGATIFGYVVNVAQQYGVIELNKHGRARSIEEKQHHPKSNIVVTGL